MQSVTYRLQIQNMRPLMTTIWNNLQGWLQENPDLEITIRPAQIQTQHRAKPPPVEDLSNLGRTGMGIRQAVQSGCVARILQTPIYRL